MSIKSKPLTTSRYIAIFMALVTIGFGLSVIIGWHAHITPLIRYKADTIAMVYNTALCFILSGIGILSLIYDYSRLALVVGSVILITGILGLSQHLFGIDLGIDQLLFEHYDAVANTYPGRMAPNTAANFIFTAVALLLIIGHRFRKFCLTLSSSLGVLILILAILFISGYFSKLQDAYEWTYITPMALNTSVGFALLSTSIIALAWYKAMIFHIKMIKTLPWVVGFCIFAATVLLFQEMEHRQKILNNLSNDHTSGLPLTTLIVGTLLAILFSLVLRFAQMAYDSAKIAKNSLSLKQATFEATADGIFVSNNEGDVIDFNKRFLKMWGISASHSQDLSRKRLFQIITQQVINKEKFSTKIEDLLRHPTKESLIELRLQNGCVFQQNVKPQFLGDEVIGRVWSYRDVTSEKQLEQQLLHQATYDTLTQLPNKALILDLMQRSFESAKQEHKSIAILLLDIDRFTQINDAFGHSKGDNLLRLIAARFKEHLPSDIVIGRLGGDEFLIISKFLERAEDITPIIHKLHKALEKPFDFYGHPLRVTCCIGITLYPKDGQDVDILLSNAEVAMIRAKREGYKSFQFYTQDMNAFALQQVKLETQLQEAILFKQFLLYYQPIFDLQNLKLIGVEALIRWHHPQKGIISPIEFIPLAEETGLIDQIGNWVLGEACHQAKLWHDQGFEDLKMSVNVAAHQFKYGFLPQMVVEALSRSQMNPKNLELELTESVLIEGSDEVVQTLNELQAMDITISLDDFGTGYSSLSYLRQFHLNKLKIDRTFIEGALQNPEDLAIIQTVVAIAKSLGMKAIAEGIETEDQLKLLIDLGCDYGQGYYLSHPLPTVECTKFLKQHKKNSYKRAAAAKVSS